MSGEGFRAPAQLMRRYGVRPKRSWGQCFLHEGQIAAQIVALLQLRPDEEVVEIGAGLGALTGLLARAAGRVVAIERDRELAEVLRAEFRDEPRVEIVEANALSYPFSKAPSPTKVVGNLPYNIASQILFHLLDERAGVTSATLMLQRELARRLLAAPGTRDYGAPTVLVRQHAELRRCLEVGRGAFLPAPRVDSSVVQLTFRAPRAQVDQARFVAVVHAAFAQRRKTLRRALRARFGGGAAAALDAAGIAASARAETLDVEQFAALTRELAAAGR